MIAVVEVVYLEADADLLRAAGRDRGAGFAASKEETLTVYRWTGEGYLAVLLAERGERVKAEPFDAIELSVGVLFGDDADE